jgi:hypothetical protein
MTNQQLYLAIGLPTLTTLAALLFNQISFSRLNDKVDRHYENFNAQVTALLTSIHGVDVRTARLEEHKH